MIQYMEARVECDHIPSMSCIIGCVAYIHLHNEDRINDANILRVAGWQVDTREGVIVRTMCPVHRDDRHGTTTSHEIPRSAYHDNTIEMISISSNVEPEGDEP